MQHIRHRSCLGQAHTVANPENTARVVNAMHKDRHLEHSFPVIGIEYEQQHCTCNRSGFWIPQDTLPGDPMSTDRHTEEAEQVYITGIFTAEPY
jgi:hypothetical protein